MCIKIAAAAVEVNIASDPHASSSITSFGMFLSKINLFSPLRLAFSPANGSNCLNKKPIKIIINEAIAASTCALSSSGVIISIEKKLAIWKIKSIEPIYIKDFPLKPIYKIC